MARALFIVLFVFSMSTMVMSQEKDQPELVSQSATKPPINSFFKDSTLHPAACAETWSISGIVESEQSKIYNYFFIVQRTNETFHYYAQISDLIGKKVIFKQSESATLTLATRQGINFKIGKGFLRYNEINDSWLFGVEGKSGFNLRVESLQPDSYRVTHLNGISFYTLQSKRVNGQLADTDNKAEFVTSSNAWVAHQWQDAGLKQSLLLERLLCRTTANEGFLLIRALEDKKMIFSQADWLDKKGDSHPISQFSVFSQTEPTKWKVKIFAPSKIFTIQTDLPQQAHTDNKVTDYYLGAMHDLDKSHPVIGACTIIKDHSLALSKAGSKVTTESTP